METPAKYDREPDPDPDPKLIGKWDPDTKKKVSAKSTCSLPVHRQIIAFYYVLVMKNNIYYVLQYVHVIFVICDVIFN
jgi:hypothetical protein